jgi:hypothetical protein
MRLRGAGSGWRIAWLAMLAGLTVAALSVANGYAAAPATGMGLQCPGDQIGILNILYDAAYVEGRSPEQQADQMIGQLHIGGVPGSPRPDLVPVHQSDSHRELAIRNRTGQTMALFTFEYRGQRGWQLDHVARCP